MLLGNLGTDPEVRQTSNGNLVANISLATQDKYKDSQGQVQKETEWHRLVVWGKTADVAQKYLKKGSRIYVEGKIQTRSYQDKKSGETKYSTEVKVFQLLLLDPPPQNQGQGQRPMNQGQAQAPRPPAPQNQPWNQGGQPQAPAQQPWNQGNQAQPQFNPNNVPNVDDVDDGFPF